VCVTKPARGASAESQADAPVRGMPVADFTKANARNAISRRPHYNNKDPAEGNAGAPSSSLSPLRVRVCVRDTHPSVILAFAFAPLPLLPPSPSPPPPPAKPMYAFSYRAPNKPFLHVDGRRDGYAPGTLPRTGRRPSLPPPPPPPPL
jgi:hypothetical protein